MQVGLLNFLGAMAKILANHILQTRAIMKTSEAVTRETFVTYVYE